MLNKVLPSTCPSCRHGLTVVKLKCGECGASVEGEFALPVLARLDVDEQLLAVNFLNCSGSLKELARQYGVSYPTVRNRLDALIDRLRSLSTSSSGTEESQP
jgi:hypothetical protein